MGLLVALHHGEAQELGCTPVFVTVFATSLNGFPIFAITLTPTAEWGEKESV